ncbi:MAG: hypothetical protein AABY40_04365 [Nanoarchaeota archaeon]
MDHNQFKIREYDFWDLFLQINQFPYIGRCYAWAKRENSDKVTDIKSGELLELFGDILPAWNKAVYELFSHDRPNLAILGNTAPRLHAHLIPHYNTPREFYGITFTDPNPTGNYAPYPKQKIELDILFKIKDSIKEKL